MRITIIAPMKSILDTANKVLIKQHFGWPGDIDVVVGLLEAGLEQAYKAINRGTDVIVSRGGTATLIAKSVDIPVVEIQVTAIDILRALKSIGNVSGPVGVIFGRRLLFECEKLGELIGVPIREIHVKDEVFEEKIQIAYREGIRTFLGDALTVRLLKERGLHVIPIESSEDAISKAIADAINLATVRRREQEKAELFRTIVNTSVDGIIAIDRGGHVNVFNPAAEQMFQIQCSTAIGKPIGDIIPDDKLQECLVDDTYEREGVKSIGNRIFAIKRIPIKLHKDIVGAIANIQDVTQLQYFEQVVRQKLNKKGLIAKFKLEQLVGSSVAMNAVKERIRQYASTDATVLITGESGTGKERIAQSIHNISRRRNGPFVAINCAALPEHLLESELFGYEEGAFTGAKKGGKSGLFELAHGGTIFLDEISEMPLSLQARILRVLQEKEVMRLGADSVIPVNVRVLSSSNQDLMGQVEGKKFRVDLYYRLDVLRLHVPPLRERVEDIPDLVQSFLDKIPASRHKIVAISEEAVKFLQRQPWRGNIRELENVIERIRLLCKGSIIEELDVRQEFASWAHLSDGQASMHKPGSVDVSEKQKIEQVLLEEKYNYTQTAKRMGISRTTLWRKLREWHKIH